MRQASLSLMWRNLRRIDRASGGAVFSPPESEAHFKASMQYYAQAMQQPTKLGGYKDRCEIRYNYSCAAVSCGQPEVHFFLLLQCRGVQVGCPHTPKPGHMVHVLSQKLQNHREDTACIRHRFDATVPGLCLALDLPCCRSL